MSLRRQSTLHFETLKDALGEIVHDADHMKEKGLSTFTFFLGTMNLIFSSFLIGAYPEHFWLVYSTQGLFLISIRVHDAIQKKIIFYFFDFCWVANFVMVASGLLMLYEVIQEQMPWLPSNTMYPRDPQFAFMLFVAACGPLACANVALGNALIFHDLLNYSATFIHLWPVCMMVTLRWNIRDVVAAWPGHFESFLIESQPTTIELVSPALKFYFTWWVTFTTWMAVHGRFQSPETTGYDTVYLNLLRGAPSVMKNILGIRSDSDFDKLFPLLKYMLIHACTVIVAFFVAVLPFRSFYAHVCWVLILISSSIWHASERYFYYLVVKPKKLLEKKIKHDHPNKAINEK